MSGDLVCSVTQTKYFSEASDNFEGSSKENIKGKHFAHCTKSWKFWANMRIFS